MREPGLDIFPLVGWDYYARSHKRSNPSKLCPAIAYIDDYEDIRSDEQNEPIPHHAIDIFANTGTPNIAVVDGMAWPNKQLGDTDKSWIYFSRGGYHCYVWGDDGFIYYYAHLLDYPLIKPGDRVRKGEIIGQTNSSGVVYSCPHTHFAIYKTSSVGAKLGPVNPYPYLRAATVLDMEDVLAWSVGRQADRGKNLVLRPQPNNGPIFKTEPMRSRLGSLGIGLGVASGALALGGLAAGIATRRP